MFLKKGCILLGSSLNASESRLFVIVHIYIHFIYIHWLFMSKIWCSLIHHSLGNVLSPFLLVSGFLWTPHKLEKIDPLKSSPPFKLVLISLLNAWNTSWWILIFSRVAISTYIFARPYLWMHACMNVRMSVCPISLFSGLAPIAP